MSTASGTTLSSKKGQRNELDSVTSSTTFPAEEGTARLPRTQDNLLNELNSQTLSEATRNVDSLLRYQAIFDTFLSSIDDGSIAQPDTQTLLASQLRTCRDTWARDIQTLVQPIRTLLCQQLSSTYARQSEVQEQWGLLYGLDTPARLPAIHLDGGAQPLLPPLSQHAPSYVNPFHPLGSTLIVEEKKKAAATKARAKKVAASEVATATDVEEEDNENNDDDKDEDTDVVMNQFNTVVQEMMSGEGEEKEADET